jgi:hypothetical protein
VGVQETNFLTYIQICSCSTGDDQTNFDLNRCKPDDMASHSLVLTALLAVTAAASPLVSAEVNTGLLNVDIDLQGVSSAVKSLFLPGSLNSTTPTNSTSRCKVYPGDEAWPSDDA